jgi:hypothetical protein
MAAKSPGVLMMAAASAARNPLVTESLGRLPADDGRDCRRDRGECGGPLLAQTGPDRTHLPAAVYRGHRNRVDMGEPEPSR